MNVKLLSIKDLNDNSIDWSETIFALYNNIGYIDKVTSGEIMTLKDNNARCICHLSTTVQSVAYLENNKKIEITTLDRKYLFEILDYYKFQNHMLNLLHQY